MVVEIQYLRGRGVDPHSCLFINKKARMTLCGTTASPAWRSPSWTCSISLPRLALCTGYRYKGAVLHEMPSDIAVLEQVEPLYEELPGWQQSTVEDLLVCEVSIISTGRGREQTVVRRSLLEPAAGCIDWEGA